MADIIYRIFVTLVLLGNVFAANSPKLTNICQFPADAKKQSGFNVALKNFALWAVSGNDYHSLLKFPATGTTDDGTFDGQTKPYIDVSGWFPKIFGTTYWITANMVGELTGYFVPTETGEYTFSLQNSDDAAIIFFGNPSAFPCGSMSTWPTPQEADITVCDSFLAQKTLYLIEGMAYPVRISWYNVGGNAKLDAQFTDPSGTVHADWNGYIWRYDDMENVTYIPTPSASTTTESGYVLSTTTTSTSTSQYTDVNGYVTEEDFYYEEVPTSTEYISVPDPITSHMGNYSITGDQIISFFSTTGSDGRPYTGSTTIYNLHSLTYNFSIPAPKTINLGNWSVTGDEVISYYSTTESDGRPVTTSTTMFRMHNVSNSINVPEPITNAIGNYSVTGDEIISFYSTKASDGRPITGSTTIYDLHNISHPTSSSQPIPHMNSSSAIVSNSDPISHVPSSSVTQESILPSSTVIQDSILSSTTTSHFTTGNWDVEKVVSYYGTIDSLNRTIQTSGTVFYSHEIKASSSPGFNQSVPSTKPDTMETLPTPTVYLTKTSLSTRHSVITVTSCDDHACNVVTKTVDDIVSLTTTYCPDTEAAEQEDNKIMVNTITVTSSDCSNGVCDEVVVTTTIEAEDDQYPMETVTTTTTVTDDFDTVTETERITAQGVNGATTVTEVVRVTVEEYDNDIVVTETAAAVEEDELYISTVTETVDEFNTINKVVTKTEQERKNINKKQTTLGTVVKSNENNALTSSDKMAQVTNTKVTSGLAVQSINIGDKKSAKFLTVITMFISSIVLSFF